VPVTELAIDTWHNVIDTNLHGTFLMSRCFAQKLKAQGQGGAIINISTLDARPLAPNTAAYAASKLAVNGLTTVLAGKLGSAGIRVNAVCRGLIDTSRLDDLPRGEAWDTMVRRFIPLGRAGSGDDIANLVAFLCSAEGSWISGQSLYVDGGHGATPLA
jgi:3-oxoacyl-[acyl-carrier protein] reductase